MKRIVILTGGTIDTEFAAGYLRRYPAELVVAVDKGMAAARALGICPDYVVGDYDSAPEGVLEEMQERFLATGKPVIRTYQPEKDATDTEIAVNLALSLEPDSITILGATGTRFDHALANVHMLYLALMREIPAVLVDGHNRIFLADKPFQIRKKEAFGDYVSLLPFTESVEGVTLRGMKYPLTDHRLEMGSSLGVSNEIAAPEASVEFREGILLVFETRD